MTTAELRRQPAASAGRSEPARVSEIATKKGFDELFKAHYEGVYRLLYRMVGTREEAEDLAQETFLRLHRADHLWDPQRLSKSVRAGAGRLNGDDFCEQTHNIRGWLYRVASNLAYNTLRSERRRTRRQEETARQATVMVSGEEDPAELAMQADERRAVRRALAELSQQQAQLLLLRHSGLSYRELAEALEVAPGSVGTLLARAEIAFERSYRRSVSGQGGENGV